MAEESLKASTRHVVMGLYLESALHASSHPPVTRTAQTGPLYIRPSSSGYTPDHIFKTGHSANLVGRSFTNIRGRAI